MARERWSHDQSETATLRRYLKEISQYPTLDHQGELELARRIQQGEH